MFTGLLLAILTTPDCLALSSLSGTIQDRFKKPIDGARVSIWEPGSAKRVQTTAAGRYSFAGIQQGSYLVNVEMAGMAMLYGAVQVAANDHHELNLILVRQETGMEPAVKAESPYDLPPGKSAISKARPQKVKPARLLRQVAPSYPATTKVRAMGDRVQIAAVIRADGIPDDMIVLSAPNQEFALAALTAVRQWRYSPTYVDGQAVEVVTIMDVLFHPR